MEINKPFATCMFILSSIPTLSNAKITNRINNEGNYPLTSRIIYDKLRQLSLKSKYKRMEKLIKQFNIFFDGTAKREIKDNELHITIGAKTLFLSLPEVNGGCSKGSSRPV